MEIVGVLQSPLVGVSLLVTLFYFGTSVLSHVINATLSIAYRVRKVDGSGTLTGPRYKFPDGQLMEKFLGNKGFEWEQKYGRVYRIWVGTNPEIVLTDPKDVETMYQKFADLRKTYAANSGSLFVELIGSGLGFLSGKRWSNLKATLDPTFSHRNALNFFSSFDKMARDYASNIEGHARSVNRGPDGTPSLIVDLSNSVQKYPFFEVAKIFYGPMTPDEQDRMWEIGKDFINLSRSMLSGGLHRYKFSKYLAFDSWTIARKYQAAWKEFNMDMYNSRKDINPEELIVTFTEAAKRGEISYQEVIDTVAESSFANLDIISHVVSSYILLLADDEAVQDELLVEMKQNMSDIEAYIKRTDTLLHYCLLESIRLRPPLSFTFPEEIQQEKQFGGFIVPKKTSVVVDSLAINIRNPFWGPDSDVYRPRRFENIKPRQLRYNLLVFGYGPRKCLGQHIADTMVKLMAYHFFLRYELSIMRPDVGSKPNVRSGSGGELVLRERKDYNSEKK